MRYKPFLLSPLGLVVAAYNPATAADLPTAPRRMPAKAPPVVAPYAPAWAGWYIGVHAGVIADESKQNGYLPNELVNDNYCWAFDDCDFSNKQRAIGFLGGGQIGYNFQAGSTVFGFEADISWSSAKKTETGSQGLYDWTAKTGPEVFGTARLRLGYAFDRALVYATGGLAYAKLRNTFQNDTGYTWSEGDDWRLGWTVGGGIEFALGSNWTIKGEGLYYDLGKQDHVSNGFEFGETQAAGLQDKTTGFVGRIGLNYIFK
jgi:outer membrane immunogenic protein